MEWLERERLTLQASLISSFMALEQAQRKPHALVHTLQCTASASELHVPSELLFTLHRWLAGEGSGSDRFPTTMHTLPCQSAHLKTDEWMKPPKVVDANKPLLRTAGRAHTQIWRGVSA